MNQQQVIVIRKRTTKVPPTPTNTPRKPDEQHGLHRQESRRYLQGLRLTAPSSRHTLPEPVPGGALPLTPRRAQTVDPVDVGSMPGWSLLASVLWSGADTATLQRSVASALESIGSIETLVATAGECLMQARQLAARASLDIASRCRLGDLLHHCLAMQALCVTDEAGLLTPLIDGLLAVAAFDPQQRPTAKLAAARRILKGLEEHRSDQGEDALGEVRAQVAELEAQVAGRRTRRVMSALEDWGLTHDEIDDCLNDDVLQAFVRLLEEAALTPEFRRGAEGPPQVARFAPITASSSDVADVVGAMAAQGRYTLAVQLLAGHLLSRSTVDDSDEAFPRLLRLCASLWGQVEKDGVSRITLFRSAEHVRLLLEGGLVRGAWLPAIATRLLGDVRLPTRDSRLLRLDRMTSVCRVLQAAASGTCTGGSEATILQVAADVAAGCPGWGREAIEQWVRRCDEVTPGRWHSRFLACLDARLDRNSQIRSACDDLRIGAFPFALVRSGGSDAVYWEFDPSGRQRSFRWDLHGAAFMAFAHARLDQALEIDPAEARQWFDIVRADLRPARASDRARLLALVMRAMGRSKELLDDITLCDRLGQLALEPVAVGGAMALCGVDAFQLCVELVSHKGISTSSSGVWILQKQMLRSPVFEGMCASMPGTRMLDDLLGRVMSDPALLVRQPMRQLLRILVDTEGTRPPCRALVSHPMLREALNRSGTDIRLAMFECLLLMPREARSRRVQAMGITPPKGLSSLFASKGEPRHLAFRQLRESLATVEPLDPRLQLAALGAARADSLPASSSISLAEGLLRLHQALSPAAMSHRQGEKRIQRLVDLVRLTSRLVNERPDETSQAFFHLFPPLGDPSDSESMVAFQGSRSIESGGRAMQSKGTPGLFAFAALLTCLHLIEEQPLPVDDCFEAASLARLMCAALWLDEGRGLRCRQQLVQAQRHAHRVRHWLLSPAWFSALRAELFEASAAMRG